MNEKYKRVILIDTENQGTAFIEDLKELLNTDLVVCMHTAYSPSFSYEQVAEFLNSKASFKFRSCQAGTPNALDFQLSSLLGYYVRQDEIDDSGTEFIILSADNGYLPVVNFWVQQGKSVAIKRKLTGENVDVASELARLSASPIRRNTSLQVAANKASISGNTNKATVELQKQASIQKQKQFVNKQKQTAMQVAQQIKTKEHIQSTEKRAQSSAITKFNEKLQKAEEIRKQKEQVKKGITSNVDAEVAVTLELKTEVAETKKEEKATTLGNTSSETKKDVQNKGLDIAQEKAEAGLSDVEVKEVTNTEVKETVLTDIESKAIKAAFENSLTNGTASLDGVEISVKFAEKLNIFSQGLNKTDLYNKISYIANSTPVGNIISENAKKVKRYLKCSVTDSTITAYIIYYAKDFDELRKYLGDYLTGSRKDANINSLIKRIEQNHFNVTMTV